MSASLPDSTWLPLAAELDRWSEAGRQIRLWLRDDDAVAPTPALDRLWLLGERFALPVLLAVIPMQAEPALAEALHDRPSLLACQHGCRHVNHAPAGQKNPNSACSARSTRSDRRSKRRGPGFVRCSGMPCCRSSCRPGTGSIPAMPLCCRRSASPASPAFAASRCAQPAARLSPIPTSTSWTGAAAASAARLRTSSPRPAACSRRVASAPPRRRTASACSSTTAT